MALTPCKITYIIHDIIIFHNEKLRSARKIVHEGNESKNAPTDVIEPQIVLKRLKNS